MSRFVLAGFVIARPSHSLFTSQLFSNAQRNKPFQFFFSEALRSLFGWDGKTPTTAPSITTTPTSDRRYQSLSVTKLGFFALTFR